MFMRRKTVTVLVCVVLATLGVAAASRAIARPRLVCSVVTPCAARSFEKRSAEKRSLEKVEPVRSVEKGWLGVEIQDLTPDLREVLGLDEDTRGVLVAGVNKGGPAENAGIAKGDVIVALDAKNVENTFGLVSVVNKKKPAEVVAVALLREGQKRNVKVTLGRRPKETGEDVITRIPTNQPREKRERGDVETPGSEFPDLESLPPLQHLKLELDRGRLGVNVVDLNTDLAVYFGTTKGVLVTEVIDGTAAEEAGIKAGDVIIKTDGKPVENKRELIRILSKREVGDKVELSVLRRGKEMKLSATLEEGPFMAWVQGIRKKGSSIPDRYITPGVERFKGNVELRRRLDDLSREIDELRKKLDDLKEDPEVRND